MTVENQMAQALAEICFLAGPLGLVTQRDKDKALCNRFNLNENELSTTYHLLIQDISNKAQKALSLYEKHENENLKTAAENMIKAHSEFNDTYVSGAKVKSDRYVNAIDNMAIMSAKLRVTLKNL